MAGTLFLSFLGSLVICMALIPVLTVSAGRLHLIDVPRDRRQHPEPVAKVGGIALAVGTMLAVMLWAPKEPLLKFSLFGGVIILLFGVWDDRVGLGYRIKFVGQTVAACGAIVLAGVHLAVLPMGEGGGWLWWITSIVTLLVIVGMTNAVNLADGLDGLAGGLSLLSFSGIAVLAHHSNDEALLLLVVAVLGALLGFMRFNTHPARIFMGDAGSQFLGHYLAVAALVLVDPSRGPYSPAIILFLWGVPLLDMVGVMGRRLWDGVSPFIGDRNHIHHRLLALGLSHRQAVLTIYALHTVSIGCAFALRWQTDALVLTVFVLFASLVLTVFVVDPRTGISSTFSLPWVHQSVLWGSEAFRRWPARLLPWMLSLVLLLALWLPGAMPRDVGWIAAGLLVAVLIAELVRPALVWAMRLGLYIGSTCLLYYGEVAPRAMFDGALPWMQAAYLVLGVLVAIAMRTNDVSRFQMTPLDYLIVVLALALPFGSDLDMGAVHVGLLTGKLLVIFFAFEVELNREPEARSRMRWLTYGLLTGITARVGYG